MRPSVHHDIATLLAVILASTTPPPQDVPTHIKQFARILMIGERQCLLLRAVAPDNACQLMLQWPVEDGSETEQYIFEYAPERFEEACHTFAYLTGEEAGFILSVLN